MIIAILILLGVIGYAAVGIVTWVFCNQTWQPCGSRGNHSRLCECDFDRRMAAIGWPVYLTIRLVRYMVIDGIAASAIKLNQLVAEWRTREKVVREPRRIKVSSNAVMGLTDYGKRALIYEKIIKREVTPDDYKEFKPDGARIPYSWMDKGE